MNKSNRTHGNGQPEADRRIPISNSRTTFRAAWLLAAAGLASAMPAPLQAADATASNEVLEEVTVTGIRASIETAIAVKRQSNEEIEVVSAEDIGKLPDTNIAESISRLPGVTVQRSDGRASDISIRGFG